MPIDLLLLQRPENRVLQLCACGPQKQSNFSLAVEKIGDWDYFTSQLYTHRLALFFLHHIKGSEHLVPPDVLGELQETGEQMLHWNLFLLTQLQHVTRLLADGGVRVLSYKGPAISFSAYGTMALRRFVDLDLLVSAQEKSKAFSVLKTNGYHFTPHTTELSPYLRRAKMATDYETPFLSADDETLLDVHWGVTAKFESFPVSFESLWKRRVPVSSIPGVFTFGREDLILSLCFHGLKHNWEKLEWIGCLLNVLHSQNEDTLNWTNLEARCLSTGTERVLYTGLRLALDLAAADINWGQNVVGFPTALKIKVESDAVVSHLVGRFWKRILPSASIQKSEQQVMLEDHLLRLWAGLLARRGWRTKRTFLVGMLRVGFLSWENSRIALKYLGPLLQAFSSLSRWGQTRSR